jgi:hypothetical protein
MTFRAVRIVLEKLAAGAGVKQRRSREMVDKDLDVGVERDDNMVFSERPANGGDICSGWSNRRSSDLLSGLLRLSDGDCCR